MGPIRLAKSYRCLQVLQSRANETFKYSLAAIKILFLSMTIRSIYGAVKMEGELRILHVNNTYANVGLLVVTFKVLGKVYQKSGDALLKQKRLMGRVKWFRKYYRSCRPLKFEVAGLYFVDLGMSLTMGSFVVQNVANMLILGA